MDVSWGQNPQSMMEMANGRTDAGRIQAVLAEIWRVEGRYSIIFQNGRVWKKYVSFE